MKVTIHFSPLSDEHYNAIGRVAAAWTRLETVIELGIWSCSEIPIRQARVFTADMRIKPRISTLLIFGHRKFENDVSAKQRFDDLIKQVRKLEDQRNRIIHAEWQYSDAPNAAAAIRARPRKDHIEITATDMTPTDIRGIATQILKTSFELENLLREQNDVWPP